MTDLELHEDRQIARADDSRYFDLVLKQANVLASADIVPVAYRGKAADIVAAGLAGRAFGWDVMASMRNFHVIEGSASLRPEAMLGLVRQAGHSVTIDVSDGVAIAVGKRADLVIVNRSAGIKARTVATFVAGRTSYSSA